MTGPDGIEERTRDMDETFKEGPDPYDREYDELDREMLDVAQAKMLGWALDKVL